MRGRTEYRFERSRYVTQCACPQIYLIIAIGQTRTDERAMHEDCMSLIRCSERKKFCLITFMCACYECSNDNQQFVHWRFSSADKKPECE